MNRMKILGVFASGAATGAIISAAGLALAQGAAPALDGRPHSQTFGSIDLGREFPSMAGYVLTLRATTVAPGAGHAMHSHKGAPEIVHIVSGVLNDQRNGASPTAHGAGDTLINDGAVSNAVINLGKAPVVYYAATVARPPKAPTAP